MPGLSHWNSLRTVCTAVVSVAALSACVLTASAEELVLGNVAIPHSPLKKSSAGGRAIRPSLIETSDLLRAAAARANHSVDGTGFACAVLGTGLRVTHTDFAGKVPVVRNFTTDDGGNPDIVTDTQGLGTHTAGVIAANGVHTGIAPGARIVPLKILTNSFMGGPNELLAALDWVIANRVTHNITCVNFPVGFGLNLATDDSADPVVNAIRDRIFTLRFFRVAMVCNSGDFFAVHSSAQGMDFPAIIRETISVGELFDANHGQISYSDGAIANTTALGRITPISQRLHPSVNADSRTDIFSFGTFLTASGVADNNASEVRGGGGPASATVAGIVLLMQELFVRETGQLPNVNLLETTLRTSPFLNTDGDDEDDNVTNTGLQFIEADALVPLNNLATTATTISEVLATFSGGRLTLTGNSNANIVTLNYTKTTVTVVSNAGTLINGFPEPLAFRLQKGQKHSLVIVGNGGADAFTINAAPLTSCNISLGAGADSCNLNFCKIKQFDLNGGTEVDSLTLNGTKLPKKKTTIISVP